jgi:hypothetical protein
MIFFMDSSPIELRRDSTRATQKSSRRLICERQSSGLETWRWNGGIRKRGHHGTRRIYIDGTERQIERRWRAADDRIQRQTAAGNLARWGAVGILSNVRCVTNDAMRMMLMRRWQRLIMAARHD